MNDSRMKNRRAVSLIELLVSLSIIGILIALTLPAIQTARARARQTQCASRLRQFGINHQVASQSRINQCPDSIDGLGYFRNKATFVQTGFESTTTTLLQFEHAGARRYGYRKDEPPRPDDPLEWFSPASIQARQVWPKVQSYIATKQHIGETANYLYLDGHIAVIPSRVIEDWCNEGFNFALRGNGTPPLR